MGELTIRSRELEGYTWTRVCLYRCIVFFSIRQIVLSPVGTAILYRVLYLYNNEDVSLICQLPITFKTLVYLAYILWLRFNCQKWIEDKWLKIIIKYFSWFKFTVCLVKLNKYCENFRFIVSLKYKIK